MEVSGQLHAPVPIALGSWVGPRAGLDVVVKRENPIITPCRELKHENRY